jgi:multidrug transporter EmrE-like cation transporter
MSVISFLLLSLTSLVTAASQTLFKYTLTGSGEPPKEGSDYVPFFLGLIQTPSFLIALFFYGLAFVLWIVLLSRNSLSLIYPIGISLNVLLTLITARFILGESLSLIHVIGIMVILCGIFIVTR